MDIEEYRLAEKIIEQYKPCFAPGCIRVEKTDVMVQTIGYGQIKYWCPKCYPKWESSLKDCD